MCIPTPAGCRFTDHGGGRFHTVCVEGYTLGSGTLTITEKPLGEVQSVAFSQTNNS